VAWDVAVATMLADSYLPDSSLNAAAAAEAATFRKEVKYSLILISADCCRDTGTDQWVSRWLPPWAGTWDLLQVPGATTCLSITAALSQCAAF